MLVYKYRGGAFDRDLNALKKDEFWASSTQQLNDPCEGLISTENFDSAINTLKTLFPQQKNSTDILKQAFENIISMKDKKLGIFSLSKVHTDELLWAHYADSHKGFCIEYELSILLKNQYLPYRSFDVSYTNQIPNLNLSQIISEKGEDSLVKTMLGHKSKRWEYENEIRIITENSGLNTYDYRAVKSIYFGLRMPQNQIDEIMQTMAGRNIQYFKMELKPYSFELETIKIDDKFPTSKKYKYFIAPITEDLDSVIFYLKPEYKPFSEYITKLAEIVRRDPNCYEVTCIDLSLGKSTPLKPIFFAQYKNSKNDWPQLTVHYSKEQIDEEYEKIDDL